MEISARRIDTQGPSRRACLFPGRKGECILKKLGDRCSVQYLSGDVALDECRLVARYGRCRHEFERKDTGPGKPAKWIGLRLPIQIAERRGKSKRMVLGTLVVSEDGL